MRDVLCYGTGHEGCLIVNCLFLHELRSMYSYYCIHFTGVNIVNTSMYSVFVYLWYEVLSTEV